MPQPDYFSRYENIAFRREDGILEMRLHTRGGPALWGFWGGLHRDLGLAFRDVAEDTANRVVILTGTGDSFINGFDLESEAMPPMGPDAWDTIFREGRRLLRNLLSIEVPVIAAVNGPATIHAELAVMADIVLASDTTVFADKPHALAGVVPGDGVHVIWPMLLGPNRGRYFLLTGQEIDAREALRLGVVGEVLPAGELNARAWHHARTLAARPAMASRYTRMLLTRALSAGLESELGQGLIMEGMAILGASAQQSQ